MLKRITFYCLLCFISQFFCPLVNGQKSTIDTVNFSRNSKDSGSTKNPLSLDKHNKFNPRLATIRSAIIPGWGQAYNRRYWKIPIIYAALGITTATFVYNVNLYKLLKQAYIKRTDTDPSNDNDIDPRFVLLSTESIRSYRNQFRQDVDYSVLFFLFFWGLNVVDATVDAHLKTFDVSEDLSLKLKPKYDPILKTPALSLIFTFKDKHQKTAPYHP
jgi:hypothetical protein